MACPPGPARDELLAALVEGERTAAFAVPERGGVFDPSALTVTADGNTLGGVVERIVDADSADDAARRIAVRSNCAPPKPVPGK